ncbi:MAG: BtpA/SgcQ family protein [Candidatus Methylacidiphilales bacterium]
MRNQAEIIAMLHVPALPGTPRNTLPMPKILQHVLKDVEVARVAGVDGVLVENMHDRPFLNRRVGPEIVAAMTVVTRAVVQAFPKSVGVQILAGANQEALAVALAAGAHFIRVEGFVYGHVADEGWMESDAGDLLRARKSWGAEQIRILADVKKKHAAHAATGDVSLADTVRAAQFFHADGVVVTGSATGQPTAPDEVSEAAKASPLPVWVGSGVDIENVSSYLPMASGLIVGSSAKRGNDCTAPLDRIRLQALVRAVRASSAGRKRP